MGNKSAAFGPLRWSALLASGSVLKENGKIGDSVGGCVINACRIIITRDDDLHSMGSFAREGLLMTQREKLSTTTNARQMYYKMMRLIMVQHAFGRT